MGSWPWWYHVIRIHRLWAKPLTLTKFQCSKSIWSPNAKHATTGHTISFILMDVIPHYSLENTNTMTRAINTGPDSKIAHHFWVSWFVKNNSWKCKSIEFILLRVLPGQMKVRNNINKYQKNWLSISNTSWNFHPIQLIN